MAFFRNMKGIFQESWDIFGNAAYLAIKLQNAIPQVSCKMSFNITYWSSPLPPPKMHGWELYFSFMHNIFFFFFFIFFYTLFSPSSDIQRVGEDHPSACLMHNIFWPSIGFIKAKDLYNLMNFCIHKMFFLPRNPFRFQSQAGSQTRNFLPAELLTFYQ